MSDAPVPPGDVRIRVLVAEGSPRIVANIVSRLGREPDIEVVGSTSDGRFAIQESIRLRPDVAVIDHALPNQDGVEVTETLVQRLPKTGVILLSMEGENDSYRQAMLAGAREFLQKPFRGDELVQAIRRVHDFERRKQESLRHRNVSAAAATAPATVGAGSTSPTAPAADADRAGGEVFVVVAGKGGVGKTTVAVNLATELARSTGTEVALVDLSLQFGDVAALLNLTVETSIADIAANNAASDADVIDQVMMTGPEGVRLLLAPTSPELADYVTTAHIRALLTQLRAEFRFIIIDAPAYLTDVALDAVELADRIVIIADYSLTSLKNARLVRRVMDALKVPPAKLLFVINNHRELTDGLDRSSAETHLRSPIAVEIPHDPATINGAMVHGLPFVSGQPMAPASVALSKLAAALTPLAHVTEVPVVPTDITDQRRRQRGLMRFAR